MECFAFISGILSGIANLLLYCYFGYLATESYLMISDHLYEFKWYNRPIKFQKKLNFMIQNAQQEHFFHGFSIAKLNLNTFTQVYCGMVFGFWFFFCLFFETEILKAYSLLDFCRF